MRRRTVLAGGGVALSPLLGGCFAASTFVDDSPSLPAGVSVSAEHAVWDVLPESRERQQRIYDGESVHRLFTDRRTAAESISSDHVPESFLDGTDFDESFVVVVQYGTSSGLYLELDSIERTDDGLALTVDVEAPPSDSGYPDDLAIHSLLLRITDSRAAVPGSLSVTVDHRR